MLFIIVVEAKSLRLKSRCRLIWSCEGPLLVLCFRMGTQAEEAKAFRDFCKCMDPISKTWWCQENHFPKVSHPDSFKFEVRNSLCIFSMTYFNLNSHDGSV